MSKYEEYGTAKNPDDKWSGSRMLFLPEGDKYVHNHMNFGNFLWSATGYTLGFSLNLLKKGAHTNSLFSRRNGYGAQFDSADDQLSIQRGQMFALKYNFRACLEHHPTIQTHPTILIH